jgi:hypothetical protein
MKLITSECAPGYPVSGGLAVSIADRKPAPHAAVMQLWGQRQRFGRNLGVVRVQTVITDAPGHWSAPPFVRRP